MTAISFLTILPFGPKEKVTDKDLGGSLRFFPLVGILIGLIAVFAASITGWLPRPVSGALVLITMVVVTGGVHLDGFADSCDGLYGHIPKERRLAIMRDSSIGVMGTLGLVLLLLLKYALIISVPEDMLWRVLIVMPLVGRWAQVTACTTSCYARDNGKARSFIEHAGKGALPGATLFSLAAAILILGGIGIVTFLSAAAFTGIVTAWIKRRIGGMTGDTIGAVSELIEVVTGLMILSVIYA